MISSGLLSPAALIFRGRYGRLDGFSRDCIALIAHSRGQMGPWDYQFARGWRFMAGGRPENRPSDTIFPAGLQRTVGLYLSIWKEGLGRSTCSLLSVNPDLPALCIECPLTKTEVRELTKLCLKRGLIRYWIQMSPVWFLTPLQ